ncbi:hypothetical protein [Microbacterium enclense]|uniref:hypothetical protein n=1 Tax=Microbacterium enclense TaxID=993073 RepID=UPI003F7CD797
MSFTLPKTEEDTATAISNIEVALGHGFDVPVAVAHDVLHRWPDTSQPSLSAALLSIQRSYLGRHESLESLARALAARVLPSNAQGWPLTKVDWAVAALDLVPDIREGVLVEIRDHHWIVRDGAIV